jgi:subtilisin family serine protease
LKEFRVRKLLAAASIAALGAAGVSLGTTSTAGAAARGPARTFNVLYKAGANLADARAAVKAAGGTITAENTKVGLATVTTTDANFVSNVRRQSVLFGAASQRPVGKAPKAKRAAVYTVEKTGAREGKADAARPGTGSTAPGSDPLTDLQWDMKMIHAPEAHTVNAGDKRVLVGVLDTGVDGSHPDIAPNFNKALSRNFTTDIPADPNGVEIDGPCEFAGCVDPVDWDDNGHGTHVAGTIESPVNGVGIAGVAPNVTIVNIRAGQDSGYFFLQPSVDALTYAGDIGIDVANMSYYIDPWLYNCASNPADSPDAQLEQRTIIAATQRALNYAHSKGVTLVAAAGNEETDLGHPTFDPTSPDYPADAAYDRDVDNSCLDMPTEGEHVVVVSAVGPSSRKSYYSNYGVEQINVSAPGGDRNDFPGTPDYRVRAKTVILAPYSYAAALNEGAVDPDTGEILQPWATKDCSSGTCSYYQWLQGTSMASPHAVGVAALIVSEYGNPDGKHKGGLTLNPVQTEKLLIRNATPHACPEPREYVYTNIAGSDDFSATCEGSTAFNGFYGHGIVDALSAVTLRPRL